MLNLFLFDSLTLMLEWVPIAMKIQTAIEFNTQQHFHFSLSCIEEGNGNSLQGSCLENPRDGGAWWATVYGVTQSRTQLKRLSSSSKYSQLVFGKETEAVQWRKIVFSPNGAGIIEHAKENPKIKPNLDSHLMSFTRMN